MERTRGIGVGVGRMEIWAFPSWVLPWFHSCSPFEWTLVFPIAYGELPDLDNFDPDTDAAVERAESEHVELGSEAEPVRTWFPETFIWTLVPIKWVIMGYIAWIQTYQPQQRGNGQEQSQDIVAFCAHKEKWGVEKWIRTMVQFLALLEIFQMILGLKSQTLVRCKRPPNICSATSCTCSTRTPTSFSARLFTSQSLPSLYCCMVLFHSRYRIYPFSRPFFQLVKVPLTYNLFLQHIES